MAPLPGWSELPERPAILISYGGAESAGWARALVGWLEPCGVGIVHAHTGQRAVEIIESGAVRLAVLSTEVPRPDGLRVLRAVRAFDADFPCLLVAPRATRQLLERALALRAFSVVSQPVQTAVLTDTVARMFRKYLHADLTAFGKRLDQLD